MNRNKTKQLVQGAALVAIYGILAILNIMLGTFLDIIFIYIMSIAFIIYAYRYGARYAFVALASSFVVLWIIGELYFLSMGIMTNACAIVYGLGLKKQSKKIKPLVRSLLFCKNITIFIMLDSIFQLGVLAEGYIWMQSIFPGISYSLFVMIMFLVFAFLAFVECSVFVDYTKLAMRKMNIRTS